MIAGLIKKFLLRVAEHLAAVAMVLVFFAVFVATMTYSFPRGTRLADLVIHEEFTSLPTRLSSPEMSLGRFGTTSRPIVALLTQVRHRVKDRPADAIAWRDARAGIDLEHRHAVQTFDRSGATIRFTPTNEMELGENSLVVLKSFVEVEGSNRKRASLIVLDGELRGRVKRSADEAVDLEVLTAASGTRFLPRAAEGEEAEFTVTANPDNTSTLALYSGTAEVVAGDRTILVETNQAVTVSADAPPSRPVPLPGRPSAIAPRDGSVYRYRSVPPRIPFRWAGDGEPDAYRLAVARDPGFEDVVYEGSVTDTAFVHGNLKVGDYYWKVSALNGWAEGPATATRRLRVVEDDEAPLLTVAFPEGFVETDRFVLRGSTEPGAEVFIDDTRVPVGDSGEFEYELQLRPGLNVVVVEAADAAGNTAYRSQLIHAKF